MEMMDISANFNVANQSALLELEKEENLVISDTTAGVITTRDLRELEALRQLEHDARRIGILALQCWKYCRNEQNEIARPTQVVNYMRNEQVPSLPSRSEMNRLRQLFGEEPLPKGGYWLNSRTTSEFKQKLNGEVQQATKVLDELVSLQTLVSPGGDLWPLVLLAKAMDEDLPSPSPLADAPRSSPSLGGGPQAPSGPAPPTHVGPVVTQILVLDSSLDSSGSDFEIQDDPITASSPRPNNA